MTMKKQLKETGRILRRFAVDLIVIVAITLLVSAVILGAFGSFKSSVFVSIVVFVGTTICVLAWHGWDDATERREQVEETLSGLEAIVEASSDAIIGVDLDGVILSWNMGARRIYGYRANETIGQQMSILFPPDRAYEVPDIFGKIARGESVKNHETMHERKKGRLIAVSLTICPIIGANGNVSGASLVARDVTERKRAEALLHQQSAAMKASMDGMAIINHSGDYIYLNDAYAKVSGYDDPRELIGKSWELFYDMEELRRFKDEIMPEFWRDGAWRGEAIGKKRDGSKYPQEISLTKVSGGGLVSVVRDITERKRVEEALQNMSLTDSLTGLCNRRGFIKRSEPHFEFARRTYKHLLLLFIDLDGMKYINDNFGHNEGDNALTTTAQILRNSLRETDVIARLGGDEFTVLVTDAAADADHVVARIQEKLKEHNERDENDYKLAFSIGAAPFDPDSLASFEEIIAKADKEMYEYKRSRKAAASLQAA